MTTTVRRRAAPADLGPAMGRFQRVYRHLVEQAVAPHGITRSEYGALSLVDLEPGITNAELARTLSVSPQASVQLVLTLSERGLVERTPHPTVARGLATRLTEAGHLLLNQARKGASAAEAELLAPLTTHEASTLVSLMQRCADEVEAP